MTHVDRPRPIVPSPSTASITSLVLAVVSLPLGLLFAIVAVIFGHRAARTDPGSRGYWLSALITGYISMVIHGFVGAVIIFLVVKAGAALVFLTPFVNGLLGL